MFVGPRCKFDHRTRNYSRMLQANVPIAFFHPLPDSFLERFGFDGLIVRICFTREVEGPESESAFGFGFDDPGFKWLIERRGERLRGFTRREWSEPGH